MGAKGIACRIFVGKPEGKRQLGKPRRRWMDTIKMDLRDRMIDQLVARPLPKYRTTQTQNKHIHTPNNHALCGIRTHDPSVRASEDNTCLRQLGYCNRRYNHYYINIFSLTLTSTGNLLLNVYLYYPDQIYVFCVRMPPC
jgi:hypothetical protein